MFGKQMLAGVLVGISVTVGQVANSKTVVFPHVLETSGTINNPQSFDNSLVFTYNGSIGGIDDNSATIDIFLYDEATGQLMEGSGGVVCGPCSYTLNRQQRKVTINLQTLIETNGGGFDTTNKTGFVVAKISGSGEASVNMVNFVVNSITGPLDNNVTGAAPVEMRTNRPPQGVPSPKRTYVIPHVLETSGRAASTPFSFDTTLFMTYAAGLGGLPAGPGASVDLYLYDDATGQPMVSGSGAEICNPCTLGLGLGGTNSPAPRKRTVVLDELITNAGGFGAAGRRTGYGIIVVGGSDPDGVAIQSSIINSHSSPSDVASFTAQLSAVRTNTSGTPSPKRTIVFPHVLEKSGLTASQNDTFDTSLFMVYTPGLAGIPSAATGATADIFLFDEKGKPLTGQSGTPVCNPCTYSFGSGTGQVRKASVRIDDLITTNGGGFDQAVKLGFGIIVVSGDDPDGISLQGMVENSHVAPASLSVFGSEPKEISAPALPFMAPPAGNEPRAFTFPHVLETKGSIKDPQYTFDTSIFMTYCGGLAGRPNNAGAAVRLYLYDANGGRPVQGSNGVEICNPCTFALTTNSPKATAVIDDLIVNNGGGFGAQTNRNMFALAVVDGDAENVAMQGQIVNSHGSAFDLSVFGFEPQPISAARLVSMPITVTNIGPFVEISVPSVIGGQYVLEQTTSFPPVWISQTNFSGDGTVKRILVPTAGASSGFLRVSGR